MYGNGLAFKGASMLTEALRAFLVSPGSADRDLNDDRETLALRSRSLFQNNSFSSALVNSVDINVVGTGIHARPLIDGEMLGIERERAEKWSRVVRKYFDLWADNKSCDAEQKNDFYQMQDLALKTQLITGDCFALCSYDSRNPFGIRVKLLEGDRCRQPYNISASERIAMGIEVDDVGAATAYYFTKKPVYGLDYYSGFAEYVKVNAFDSFGGQNVVHCFSSERPDQRRGLPFLAPIVSQLKQQERYQDAELLAAVVSAMFTVFLTSNSPDVRNDLPGGLLAPKSAAPKRTEDCALGPAAVVSLAQGEKIEIADPKRPNANYAPFVDGIFREAAAAKGQSAEHVLHYYNSSYNAVRAAINETKKTNDKIKYDFVADFCQPIYEKFLNRLVVNRLIDAPGYFDDPIKHLLWSSCRWDGEAGFMLDPTKETQALIMQLDNHLIDRDTVCRRICGMEFSEVAEKIAEERKISANLNLPEPGTVNRSESTSNTVVEESGEKSEDE